MKIIGTDNLARETVADHLVAENIRSLEFATIMCKAINDLYCKSDDSPTFYRVVEDGYRLSRGMEDLI